MPLFEGDWAILYKFPDGLTKKLGQWGYPNGVTFAWTI